MAFFGLQYFSCRLLCPVLHSRTLLFLSIAMVVFLLAITDDGSAQTMDSYPRWASKPALGNCQPAKWPIWQLCGCLQLLFHRLPCCFAPPPLSPVCSAPVTCLFQSSHPTSKLTSVDNKLAYSNFWFVSVFVFMPSELCGPAGLSCE